MKYDGHHTVVSCLEYDLYKTSTQRLSILPWRNYVLLFYLASAALVKMTSFRFIVSLLQWNLR